MPPFFVLPETKTHFFIFDIKEVEMQVILINNLTKFKRFYPEVEVNNDNPLYLQLNLNVEELEDGEYSIKLFMDDNTLVTEELVQIGEYKREKKVIQYVRK